MTESNTIKADANALFTSKDYENANSRYEDALRTCPNYLYFERAVLHSNIAACHLQLEQWKEAITSSSTALESLKTLEDETTKNRIEGSGSILNEPEDPAIEVTSMDSSGKIATPSTSGDGVRDQPSTPIKSFDNEDRINLTAKADAPRKANVDDADEEVISAGAAVSAPQLPPQPTSPSPAGALKNENIFLPPQNTQISPSPSSTSPRTLPTDKDILRIRTKALLRRARARSSAGGWSNLTGAEEDYKTLSADTSSLTPADRRTVTNQLRSLPPRTKAAQEQEMGEMWGKLKQLGDGILKPFGLSTKNFQMVKDESSGGYSMNFNQGNGGSSS